MRTLFDGSTHVSYMQFSVESGFDDMEGDRVAAGDGQANGLCGAAQPGLLQLTTGLHTGEVPVVVELHDEPPPLGDGWEDIVEASFVPQAERTFLLGWAGSSSAPLALERIPYRVRYCISGMDEGHQADTRMDGEPPLDRCLLQFWPAPPAPDEVVRETSHQAAYWNGVARDRPTPGRLLADARAAFPGLGTQAPGPRTRSMSARPGTRPATSDAANDATGQAPLGPPDHGRPEGGPPDG